MGDRLEAKSPMTELKRETWQVLEPGGRSLAPRSLGPSGSIPVMASGTPYGLLLDSDPLA